MHIKQNLNIKNLKDTYIEYLSSLIINIFLIKYPSSLNINIFLNIALTILLVYANDSPRFSVHFPVYVNLYGKKSETSKNLEHLKNKSANSRNKIFKQKTQNMKL